MRVLKIKYLILLTWLFLCLSSAQAEVCSVDRLVAPSYNTPEVYVQDLDGSDSSFTNSSTANGNFMVEVDQVNGRRYLTSYANQIVTVSDLDGSNESQLYTANRPYDLGLDVPNGKIYWMEWLDSGNIMCANTDGTGTPVSVMSNLFFNVGLAVDEVNGYVYWYEFYSSPQRIRRGTISDNCGGLTDVRDVISGVELSNSRHLSLSGDKSWLYFSNIDDSAIGRINVDGTSLDSTFISTTNAPRAVRHHLKSDRIFWTFTNGQIQSAAVDGSGSVQNEFILANAGSAWGFDICESGPQLLGFSSTTADGTYVVGDIINITATYDANLLSSSTLTITLSNGVQVVLDQVSGSSISGSYQVGSAGSGEDSADLTISSIDSQDVLNEFGFSQTSASLPSSSNLGDSANIEIISVLPVVGFDVTSPGPGGQDENLILWYRSDSGTSTTTDDVGVQTWASQQGGNNAIQNNAARRATFQNETEDEINFNPTVRFDGSDDHFDIANSVDINTAAYNQKAFHVAFKTSSEIEARQTIYEEGGGSRGINMYIVDSELYWSGWNIPNDGGVGAPWSWRGFSTPIAANTEYIATFVLNGNTAITGTIDCYLNGALVGQVTGVGRLFSHGGSIELGYRNGSYNENGRSNGQGERFEGDISEFIYYNDTALPGTSRQQVESYLAVKYGITFQGGDYLDGTGAVIYDATTDAASGGHKEYTNDIAGIGVDDHSLLEQQSSRSVNGGSIFTFSDATEIDSNKFLLWGNDGGASGSWTSIGAPAGYLKIPREWRMDETGDVGTVDIEIDLTNLPALTSVLNKYVLLVDSDSDFTSDATAFDLAVLDADTLELEGFEPGGDRFFTIAEVDLTPPTLLSFSSSTADGVYGPGSSITITANYDEALGSDSKLKVNLDNGVSIVLDSVSGSSVSGTYTVGATGSGEDSLDLTVRNINGEAVEDLFLNAQDSSIMPIAADNIAANSNIVIDVTAPIISQVTPVATPTTDATPDYVFTSDEAGDISYGGSCNSVVGSANVGNTTVTLDSDGAGAGLADGTYSDCVLSVTDAVGNISSDLAINIFVIMTGPQVKLSGSATIPETGGSASITATLSTVSINNVIVSLGYTGDAALGLDFTVNPVQILIPAGSLSGSMLLTAVDDTDFEGDEDAVISISAASNANFTAPQSVTITITDDDVGCNVNPWLAPTGTSAMMVVESNSGVFDPNDSAFTPPTGNDFDTIIMGRDASGAAARRMLAVNFFDTTYGADFSGGDISDDGQFLLIHTMIDPRYEYKLRASSDFTVDSAGGEVYIGAYIMVVNFMNPVIAAQGYATIYGTYGGGSGQLVPIGAAAVHGEILAVTPTDCTDGSNQIESFYVSFESDNPVFLNPEDNVIYYDNVVSGNYGVGVSHAKRELRYLDAARTKAKSLVTQVLSF